MVGARSRTGWASATAAWARTTIPPAPNPCTTRAMINTGMLWASAPTNDPTMITTSADMITGRRPQRSDSAPQIGSTLVAASR